MRVDGSQRSAQLMGGIVTPATLALNGSVHALQQVIDGLHQWRKLLDLPALRHGRIIPGRTLTQLLAQRLKGTQAARHSPPHQHHAGQQRQHKGQDDGVGETMDQSLTHIDTVGRGNAHAMLLKHIGSPGLAAFGDAREAQRQRPPFFEGGVIPTALSDARPRKAIGTDFQAPIFHKGHHNHMEQV